MRRLRIERIERIEGIEEIERIEGIKRIEGIEEIVRIKEIEHVVCCTRVGVIVFATLYVHGCCVHNVETACVKNKSTIIYIELRMNNKYVASVPLTLFKFCGL